MIRSPVPFKSNSEILDLSVSQQLGPSRQRTLASWIEYYEMSGRAVEEIFPLNREMKWLAACSQNLDFWLADSGYAQPLMLLVLMLLVLVLLVLVLLVLVLLVLMD